MITADIPPATVLSSCTEVAARAIHRTDVGHLAPGALADLVWWDSAWHPRRVWVGDTELGLGVPRHT